MSFVDHNALLELIRLPLGSYEHGFHQLIRIQQDLKHSYLSQDSFYHSTCTGLKLSINNEEYKKVLWVTAKRCYIQQKKSC